MRDTCINCGWKLVGVAGYLKGTDVMIGGYPTPYEMKTGIALGGDKNPKTKLDESTILYAEFTRAGLSFDMFKRMLLFPHPFNESCVNLPALDVIHKELKGISVVLVVGTDACQYLFDKDINECVATTMKSEWLPKDVTCIPIPRPGSIVGGTVGEYRLALTKYANRRRNGR